MSLLDLEELKLYLNEIIGSSFLILKRFEKCVIANTCQLKIETVNTQFIGAILSGHVTCSRRKLKAAENSS